MQHYSPSTSACRPRPRVHAEFLHSQCTNRPFWPLVSKYTIVERIVVLSYLFIYKTLTINTYDYSNFFVFFCYVLHPFRALSTLRHTKFRGCTLRELGLLSATRVLPEYQGIIMGDVAVDAADGRAAALQEDHSK